MRYFHKFFLSITLILTAALAVMEYSCVAFSLNHSFRRAQDSGLMQHQLIKHTIQSTILNTLSGGIVPEPRLSAIGENAAGLLGTGGGLLLAGEADGIYYSDLASPQDFGDIQEGYINYQVVREDGAVSLIVKSEFTQSGRRLFLVTKQDISQVFSEAENQLAQCTRLYFLILAVSTAAALGLSWALTRPLTILRRATCAFGNGDYSFRANIHARDEIGGLAQDYNKMADTVEEKIRELEAAASRQKRFTANFAHELKTPMTSVIGYADMIYQRKLSEEETEQAAWFIMNEGMRLEALSFKLMDLFALDQTGFTLEETEITTVMQDAQASLLPSAEKRGVEFVCQAEPAWVRLEYDLFKTLLLNLLDNALKSGGKHVTLLGRAEKELYCVSVSDDGRGIPSDELMRITEAFYMVDKSRSRREHGAGLGLALCARIAGIHGTKLEYVSETGKGTTVSFTLRKEAEGDEA